MDYNMLTIKQNDVIISLLRMIAENTGGEDFGFTEIFEEKLTKVHKSAEEFRKWPFNNTGPAERRTANNLFQLVLIHIDNIVMIAKKPGL